VIFLQVVKLFHSCQREKQKEKEEEKEEKEGTYSRREFSYQSFYRSFQMPENIDEKKIDANYSNGILHVVVGKKKVESPKTVKSIPVK
jgi:HSP20 family protein